MGRGGAKSTDNIYAVFHIFASEVPRFRIPGSRFRFRGFPPAIEVVTDRYKVPGSGSITQRGTLTGHMKYPPSARLMAAVSNMRGMPCQFRGCVLLGLSLCGE